MNNLKELREHILDHQREGKLYAVWNDRVPEYRSLRETEAIASRPLRYARKEQAILRDLEFEYESFEPFVGRLRLPKRDPEEAKQAAAYCQDYGWGPGQNGHCEPWYDEAFQVGLDGIRARIESLERTETRQCFLIVLEGFQSMIGNAAHAAEAAGNRELAADCRHIMNRPPETFRQALELMYLIDLGIQCGSRAGLVGPGRIDRRLIDFYRRDLTAKRITRAQALEMIATLYLFINDFCANGLAYAVMVGGSSGVNELSYLAVEALKTSFLVYPGVGVCVNDETPDDLLELAVDVLALGSPCPAFFNDKLIRRGLEYYGIPATESGEYINSTCVEITPCGRSGVWVASPYFNLSNYLLEELAEEHATYDSLYQGFLARIARAIDQATKEQNQFRRERPKIARRALQSIFTCDCIDRGLDIEEGGARYNWVECSFVGLANTVDALYVLREEVFGSGALSMAQLREVLKTDFSGYETLHEKLLHFYPKYGMDDPRVDGLIPPLLAFLEQECAKYRMEPDDAPFIPGTFCWIMHQQFGTVTAATADGRHAGFPFADGAGPAQGREKFGPTAAINSVCSWDHSRLIGGSAFNMKYSHALLDSQENRRKLVTLIKTFIARGGFETQINVFDNETLKKALADPESYRDLTVRIGGYTDYFVRLSPEMQQEVLLRTQYTNL